MRKSIEIFGFNIFSWGDDSIEAENISNDFIDIPQDKKSIGTVYPQTRSTEAPSEDLTARFIKLGTSIVRPGFQFDVIPYIRRLSIINPDVSQALNNIVLLGNTGHRVDFDNSVPADQVDLMRAHLEAKRSSWIKGSSGINGLINKYISQIMISGAIFTEFVPNLELTGLAKITLPLPETARWVYNSDTEDYVLYQKVRYPDPNNSSVQLFGLRLLNPNTVKYWGLNGDSEIPYANPPYLPAITPLETQNEMLNSIKFILSQIGLMGFLEVKIEKPEQKEGESDDKYTSRSTQLLTTTISNLSNVLKTGLVAGYEEDHKFEFHAVAKNVAGVETLFKQNELLVFSGLKTDPALAGRAYSTSESQITVVYNKLLSELSNVQAMVSVAIEYAYSLELRLAGFTFKNLKVIFNKSTIQDDLKYQQAQEIKIRNVVEKLVLGIINLEQAADELGYEKADQLQPRVAWEILAGGAAPSTGDPALDAQKKAIRKKSKGASEKKGTAKKSIKPKD